MCQDDRAGSAGSVFIQCVEGRWLPMQAQPHSRAFWEQKPLSRSCGMVGGRLVSQGGSVVQLLSVSSKDGIIWDQEDNAAQPLP